MSMVLYQINFCGLCYYSGSYSSECFEEDLYFSITKIIHVDIFIYLKNIQDHAIRMLIVLMLIVIRTLIICAAAAQLTFPVGGGYYICSGGQLNDLRAKDFQPFCSQQITV